MSEANKLPTHVCFAQIYDALDLSHGPRQESNLLQMTFIGFALAVVDDICSSLAVCARVSRNVQISMFARVLAIGQNGNARNGSMRRIVISICQRWPYRDMKCAIFANHSSAHQLPLRRISARINWSAPRQIIGDEWKAIENRFVDFAIAGTHYRRWNAHTNYIWLMIAVICAT